MGNRSQKPILFATLGYPGSGKTFFSRRLAKDLGLFHLNSDEMRLEIFPKPNYTPSESTLVFRAMDYIADKMLSDGISVVYDANSTRRVYRKRLQYIAKKRRADYVLLWFKTPIEVAIKRIKKRSNLKSELMKRLHRKIDNSVLFEIRAEEEAPDKKERHIILEPASYLKQKEQLVKFLRNNGK